MSDTLKISEMPSSTHSVANTYPVAKREIIRVTDAVPLMDTGRFEQMQRIANVMASCSLIPDALWKDGDNALPEARIIANCFLVVNQAVMWGMDPFAVAQHVSVVHGRLCYEGKLIHAIIEQKLGIRLDYAISGQGENMQVVVSGKFDNEKLPRTIEGTVAQWKTQHKGSPWPGNYPRQLRYRGAREWCRAFAPGLMLGVYDRDELEGSEVETREMIDVSPPDAPEIETVAFGAVGKVVAYDKAAKAIDGEGKEVPHDAVTGEIDLTVPAEFNRKAQKRKTADKAPAPKQDEPEALEPEEKIEEEPEEDEPPFVPDEQPAAQKADAILDTLKIDLDAAATPAQIDAAVQKHMAGIKSLLPFEIDEANGMVAAARDGLR